MAAAALRGCWRQATGAAARELVGVTPGPLAARLGRPALFPAGRSVAPSWGAGAALRRASPPLLQGPQGGAGVDDYASALAARRGGLLRPWGQQGAGASRAQVTEAAQVPRTPPPEKESFCVVKIGGKQHKICKDDSVTVEKLIGARVGDKLTFNEVLLVGLKDSTTWIGTPTVEGASVEAIVEQQTLGPKVYIYKKRRRKNSKRMRGFRAQLTSLRILDVKTP